MDLFLREMGDVFTARFDLVEACKRSDDDEAYWKTVCRERSLHASELCRHGGSWRRMALEHLLAVSIESFGLHLELPPGHDESFCRPPVDGSHPLWAGLFPAVTPFRPDGRPTKERYAAQSEEDGRVLAAPDCGWPELERLKSLARVNCRKYEGCAAWEGDGVNKDEFLPPTSVPSVSAMGGEGGAAASTAATSTTAKPGTASKKKKGAAKAPAAEPPP